MSYIFLPLAIILLFVSFLLISKGIQQFKEGFDENSQRSTLESMYRPLVILVCPALIKMRQKIGENPNNGNVDEYIFNRAGGTVITCPALKKDTLQSLDPDIGGQMIRTINFLHEYMSNIITTLNQALSVKWGDVPKASDSPLNPANAPPKTDSDTNAPTTVENFSENTLEYIYFQRIQSLNTAMSSDPSLPKKVVQLKSLLDQIIHIETDPDSIKPIVS